MTNSEINEAVARKLGWKVLSGGLLAVPPDAFDDAAKRLPNYAESIAAAWEIVEFIHNKGFDMELMHTSPQWITENPDEKWMIYVRRYDTDRNPFENVFAETAPLAICLAFLKLPD